jgi:hypothetical protein
MSGEDKRRADAFLRGGLLWLLLGGDRDTLREAVRAHQRPFPRPCEPLPDLPDRDKGEAR